MAVYSSDGCVGRCDARCHEAEELECKCVCFGANHGVGLAKAQRNTRENAEKWIPQYAERLNLKEFQAESMGAPFDQISLF